MRPLQGWAELPRAWALEPAVVVPLALLLAWYARGVWESSGPRGVVGAPRRPRRLARATRVPQTLCFLSGWLVLAIALVSPIHSLGRVLFAAHMAQHEFLMLIAAPLLVLGRPQTELLSALPRGWGRRLITAAGRPPWRTVPRALARPLVASAFQAAVLWTWQLPSLFRAALHHEGLHALQHVTLLASAVLFWWAILRGPRATPVPVTGALYLFATALHSGLLGAWVALAARPWYDAEPGLSAGFGLSPLEDQRLGGLILWIPACSLYIAAGLALMSGWLRVSGERPQRSRPKLLETPLPRAADPGARR